MTFELRPYKWRGKTYKNLTTLHNAVRKIHPNSGLGFEPDAMVVSFRTEPGEPWTRVYYDRDLETNEIADEPRGE